MSFLDELSEYLQDVGSSIDDRFDANTLEGVDPAFARNAFIRCLEKLERGKKTRKGRPQSYSDTDIGEVFELWNEGDAIVRFSNHLARSLRESIGSDASDAELDGWIEIAIARLVGLDESLPSRVRTMELDRLAANARFETFNKKRVREGIDKTSYAAAIRATRTLGPKIVLSQIGRVFLEMKGRDAIRWLLHVEAAQSIGPMDSWRISRETALALLDGEAWHFSMFGESDRFPHSWDTVKRLDALGVVSIQDDDESQITKLETLPLGRQLLGELVDKNQSTMSVLADSILADLTLSAVNSVASRNEGALEGAQSSAVAEATVRQSRLVAHEIRNMLVPVKTSLNAFYREVLLTSQPGEVVARRREEIDRGIGSVFQFISQLVELSRFVATPPESFDILPAIRDAVSTIEVETGGRVEQHLPTMLPPVSGHRARFVTALINVLRNAAQAVPSEHPFIRIEAAPLEGASAVRISVEDNGPGVPEPMRRAIFDEGVSLRGGSGLGLALVREVFEKEMRGLVACDSSSLGGARFVIRVPTTGTER